MMYKIKAIDQLFFRSGTPFEANGETHLIQSFFPPLPSTYAGALKAFAVDKESKHALKIGYNGVMHDKEFCFPKPFDITVTKEHCCVKNENEEKYYDLETMKLMSSPPSNFQLPYCLAPEYKNSKKVKSPDDIYLKQQDLQRYLNGEEGVMAGSSLSNHLHKEKKIGIRTNSKTKEEDDGMLYQIEMCRPDDKLQLAVEVKGIEIDEAKSIRLGGEGKVATVVKPKEKSEEKLEITKIESDSKYFKIYLATPAIFGKGWLPKWIDEETMIGSFSGKNKKKIKVKLIAATVDRFVPVGGFGQEKEEGKFQPREMRYAVPSGSVYYFEILNGTFQDAVSLFHQKCISDYRLNYGFEYIEPRFDRLIYCDRGFGYSMVGSLSKKQEEDLKCLKKKG